MLTHDPDTSFARVKHMCQYLHHTLGYALRYVPLSPEAKQKLWVIGDASSATTGEKSQQGFCVTMVSPLHKDWEATCFNGGQADKTSLRSLHVKQNSLLPVKLFNKERT